MMQNETTRSAALERLEHEKETNPGEPPTMPRYLNLRLIETEPAAFQVRVDGLNPDRVREIKRGLRRSDVTTHDPVTVWWTGSRWVALDGHHRLAAYEKIMDDQGGMPKVPVNSQPGLSLSEALGLASDLNSREKITITREEKSNNAWTIVCLGEGSISEQSKIAGVSTAQINIMRRTLETLKARRIPPMRLVDRGWDWCRNKAKDAPEVAWEEDDLERLGREIASELGKIAGGRAVKNPEGLARGLYLISPVLLERLIETEDFWPALDGPGRALLEEVSQEDIPEEDEDLKEDF